MMVVWFRLWCLTPFSTIFQLYSGRSFIVEFYHKQKEQFKANAYVI